MSVIFLIIISTISAWASSPTITGDEISTRHSLPVFSMAQSGTCEIDSKWLIDFGMIFFGKTQDTALNGLRLIQYPPDIDGNTQVNLIGYTSKTEDKIIVKFLAPPKTLTALRTDWLEGNYPSPSTFPVTMDSRCVNERVHLVSNLGVKLKK